MAPNPERSGRPGKAVAPLDTPTGSYPMPKASSPVMSRPMISAWMSCVPS